jgi:hypothetical protein
MWSGLWPCVVRLGPRSLRLVKATFDHLGSDGALAGAAYTVGVLGEDASLVAGFGCLEVAEASGEFFVRDVELEFAVRDVEGDGVAFADCGDGTAELRFGRYVARHEAAGGTAEAAVREKRDGFA